MRNVRIDRIKLAVELARREWQQKELAELSGVSSATISFIRNGKSCKPEIAGKIAAALNMPLEELLEVTA
jgi:DNA-binding Xre family transcriptional regulator